jgi:hypothetical protein
MISWGFDIKKKGLSFREAQMALSALLGLWLSLICD